MLRGLFGHMRKNVVGYLALFVALGGTTAYAANTVRSTDIVDNEVYSADVRNDNLAGGGLGPADLAAGSVTSSEVRDDTQGFGGLGAQDLGPNSVGSSEVVDNSLGTLDVHEESMLFNNTLNANDIAPDAVGASEIGAGAVGTDEVANGTLNDEDVGQANFVDFVADIGTVAANSCTDRFVTGTGALVDHLVLTASWLDSNSQLSYTPQYRAIVGQNTDAVAIHVCNPTESAINDTTTHFSLLVIDAQ